MNKLSSGFILLALFQMGCSRVSFVDNLSSQNKLFSIQDALINTKHNTPINFNLKIDGGDGVSSLSLIQDVQTTEQETANGKIELLSLSQRQFRYTPKFGFRGKEDFTVFAKNSLNKVIQGNVTVVVGNPIYQLQPSIAARTPGCISCHLKTSSNFITDFGLKGDKDYKDFTFGADQHSSGSPYGDHSGALNTALFMNSEAKVYVPNARLPAAIAGETHLDTFKQYFKFRLEEVNGNEEKIANQYTIHTEVVEKEHIFIGAPTAEELRNRFSLVQGDVKFFKDNQSSPALEGIKKEGAVFQNSGTLKCDGDLALDGNLLLRNLKIESADGCRIYVTGSVFIYGAIDYINKTKDTNLQISSARGIFLGLGDIMAGEEICEGVGGWYYGTFVNPNISRETFMANYSSTFKLRVKTLWTTPFTPLRLGDTLDNLGDSYLAEIAAVESKVGPLKDVTCLPDGREVSFERLLLNAPQVQSRYYGAFKGAIIAEYVLMSLSKFNFTFDPVFSSNSILPMIEPESYLTVK